MKKNILLISIILFYLLTACNISSPITTSENFLENIKAQQNDQAINLMVNQNLQSLNQNQKSIFINEIKSYGTIYSYSVDNYIPLKEIFLKKFKINEGFMIYYTLNSENKGEQHLKFKITKINGNWKIIYTDTIDQ